jgi:hypothetical protein
MRLFAVLLSVIVMALAVVPCCFDDNCGDDFLSEQTHKNNSDSPETPCSPFVSCTSCFGVCIAPSIEVVVAPVTVVEKTFPLYKQSFISLYYANIWQPPKIAC